MDLKNLVRVIPDFPKEGILFRDITTVLKDAEGLHQSVNAMSEKLEGIDFDVVVGPESRGFIFGVPIAYNMKKGFVPARKEGKLPYETIRKSYGLEYGEATIELHKDAIQKGQKVVIADDLLATGGTCKAICELIEESGAEVVGIVFFIEIEELKGRETLEGYNIHSIIKY